jgi:hypothetical protein
MPPNMSRSVTFQLDHDGSDGQSSFLSPTMSSSTLSKARSPANSKHSTSVLNRKFAVTSPAKSPAPAPAPSTKLSCESSNASVDRSPMSSLSLDPSQAWRKHGKLYRARLVLNDEDEGCNTFVLSNKCSIERYYKVAEKVGSFSRR